MPPRPGYLMAASLGAVFLAVTPAAENDSLLGFTPESAAEQLELERTFDSHITADNMAEWMEYITSKPIYVGSPHNKETADWMVEQFRSWGFDAELAEYHVMFPTPRIRELELLSPTRYTAKLREPTVEGDRTSGIEENRLPTYNAYSADGDVTGFYLQNVFLQILADLQRVQFLYQHQHQGNIPS